jgi:hypothetical protein
MTKRIDISKPAVSIRSEIATLKKPSGIAGEAMLRAETPQEQFNLIGAGRKNLIINGDMRIAQRATSHTTISDYTLDRWKFQTDALDNYAHTVTQSTDAPPGFFNSLKIEVTTTESAIASDEDLAVATYIEARDCQALAVGSASAKPLSASFWVKSSKGGIFSVSLTALDNTVKIFSTTYTVNVANTWEYKTISIPPLSGGTTINNDNGEGLTLRFPTIVGSGFAGTPAAGWASYASSLWGAGHEAQIDTDGDTWQLTGVQLEVGTVATPFEYRSYGEELALCQRYYQKFGGGASYGVLSEFGVAKSATVVTATTSLFVPMRIAPDVSTNDIQVADGVNSAIDCTSTAISGGTHTNVLAHIEYTVSSGLTIYRPYYVRNSNNTSGYVAFDAELPD